MKLVDFLGYLLLSMAPDVSPRTWAHDDPRKRKFGKTREGSKRPMASRALLRDRKKRQRDARSRQRRLRAA